MLLLILGIALTAVSWYFAWSHIGPVSEYSFFPLWVGYILFVNGLSEVSWDLPAAPYALVFPMAVRNLNSYVVVL